MQILLAFIIGAAVGAAAHFLVRGRGTRGVALAPIIGAFSAGLVWMILTWAGVGLENPLLWMSALVVPIVVTWPVLVILARTRTAHDAREKARLKIG
ncbi:hypothetical protein SAMN04487846_2326 [Microbacterium sp. cf046]|uniref:hypothetical protein n=1 Tax=Microbacterium sp. cf046 TaxID=1761803 RepID=UPI0008EE794C|nr:hypothetical protein [Microbacterium sp. cf046]SFS08093.1 hypothetical protein SAMN04487846_2326 [Microbacterium sp. cf046]